MIAARLKEQSFNLRVGLELLTLLLLAYGLQTFWLQSTLEGWGWERQVWAELLIYVLPGSVLLVWRGWRVAHSAKAQHADKTVSLVLRNCAAVFIFGLVLSGVLVKHQINGVKETAQARFDHLVELLSDGVKERFSSSLMGLRGLQAFHAAKPDVTREEFRRYVASRNMLLEFPGLRGFGYIEHVPRQQLAQFTAREQEHNADFQVTTSGQAQDLYVIKYIEPLENSRPALGFDVGAEPVRRAAVERAYSSGLPTLSGHLMPLPGRERSSDYLYMLPMHRGAARLNNERERREATVGLVYAPIIVEQLLAGIGASTQGMVAFQLFDLSSSLPGSQVYAWPQNPAGAGSQHAEEVIGAALFQSETDLLIGGQTLSLAVRSTPVFDTLVMGGKPFWAGVAGVCLSFLSSLVLWLLGMGRARALRLAEVMTQGHREATHKAEAALREHQFLLDTLNQHSLVSSADAAGRMTYANDEFCRVSGYAREELLGARYDTVRSLPESEQPLAQARAALLRGEVWSGEIAHLDKQGQPYWVKSTIAPFLDALGAIERFVAIHTDISVQKRVEAEMRVRSEQLAAIFSLTPDGFISFDAQHVVRYISPAVMQHTGLTMERMVGLDEVQLLSLLAAQGDEASSHLSMASLRHGTQYLELVRPAKKTLALSLHEGNSAEIPRVFHLRDVTHELEVEQMKSDFLATAAHELRTPMASIYGFTELLMSRQMAPERQQQMLETIYRQSQVMNAIVNDLLELARIDAMRGQDLACEPLALRPLLDELLQEFMTPVGREPVQLRFDMERCWVQADRVKLRQALRNVLSNAYKFSPEGGPVSLRLHALPELDGTWVAIEVQDQGLGMTAEELSHVTERFYRADKSGARLGTGLGMSIVKEYLELMGGQLHLQSEPGQGTTVQLRLRFATPSLTEEREAALPDATPAMAQDNTIGVRS